MSEQKAPNANSGERLEEFGYKQELNRQLGLKDVVLYGVLFMVIIAPQSIWGLVSQQSMGMSTLVYIIGFIAISFTALSYVRMSARFPIAGSVYSYVQRGINPHVGFISGWLILLDYVITPALLYVMVANWGTMLIPESPWFLWILAFVAFNTFVTIRGVSMTKGLDFIIFAIEILAVIAFVYLASKYVLGGGGTGAFVIDPLWQPGKVDAHFVAAGISIAALNFLGFDGISTLAEETHEPEKNIGRGIMIALGIIIVVFIAQTYLASLVQPDWASWDEQHANNAFFYGVQLVGGDIFMKIMLVINIIAVGIANIMNAQLAASRLLYSMGRDKVIPSIFGKVSKKWKTPWVGAIFIGVVVHELADHARQLWCAVVVHHPELCRVQVLLHQGEAPQDCGRLGEVPHLPVDRHLDLGVRVHRVRPAHLHRRRELARHRPDRGRRQVARLQGGPRGVQEPRGLTPAAK